jgi:hypothetical protein
MSVIQYSRLSYKAYPLLTQSEVCFTREYLKIYHEKSQKTQENCKENGLYCEGVDRRCLKSEEKDRKRERREGVGVVHCCLAPVVEVYSKRKRWLGSYERTES